MPLPLHPFLRPLAEQFASHADAGLAAPMQAYLKDRFPFFGIKTPMRRELVREHVSEHGAPAFDDLPAIARSAWAQPQREFHHVAADLLQKAAKKMGSEHLPLVEELIATNSWWDTVDVLAIHVAGVILKKNVRERKAWNKRWVNSSDLWLDRTAIIFQARYKQDTDTAMLFANITQHAKHPDLFIRKAIGWALRELAATDPKAVQDFVRKQPLSPLSVREALRKIT